MSNNQGPSVGRLTRTGTTYHGRPFVTRRLVINTERETLNIVMNVIDHHRLWHLDGGDHTSDRSSGLKHLPNDSVVARALAPKLTEVLVHDSLENIEEHDHDE